MAVNKIVLNEETLIDLSIDTVSKSSVLKGVTFHGADGERGIGEYEPPASSDIDLQEKVVRVTTEGITEILPDDGYALSKAIVDVDVSSADDTFCFAVYDYDGTVLKEELCHMGDVVTLPEPPNHDGLVFDGWSSVLPIIDNAITVTDRDVVVGAFYTTTDGAAKFTAEFTDESLTTACFAGLGGNYTIDWGDGSEPTVHPGPSSGAYQHEYNIESFPATYTITITGQPWSSLGTNAKNIFTSMGLVSPYKDREKSKFCSEVRFGDNFNLYFGTSACSNPFKWCYALETLAVPNRNLFYSTLNDNAFVSCHNLRGLSFPNGVSRIYSYAFSGCGNLRYVALPSSLTQILQYAFSNNSALSHITLPDGLTTIGNYAFQSCSALERVRIPDTVTSLGDYAFDKCSALEEVVLPSGLATVPLYCFNSCTNLKSVKLPDGLTKIGNYAFSGCSALRDINIPDSVTNIGSYAFSSSKITSIVIPSGVTNVLSYAFSGCTVLANVVIPETVTMMSTGVFNGCSSLRSATIPSGIASLEAYMFNNCLKLERVELPAGLTSIGSDAFNTCRSLSHINIPDPVTSIGANAFRYCYALSEIELPNGLTTVGNQAFQYCRSLKSIKIPSSVTSLSTSVFQSCEALSHVELPDGLTTIGNYAFNNCYCLTGLKLPSTITSIGVQAFYSCGGLQYLDCSLCTSIPSLGNSALSSTASNLKIIVPDNLYDAWVSATNWVSYASKIYKASEVTIE